jgi:pimeloyl-ACP methyl ester carboxylesterase
MPKIVEKKIVMEINENTVFYKIIGNGIPIITIHGFGVDHKLMENFVEKIIPGEGYKKIYFDLPGMGKTKTKNQIYHAEEVYKIIKEFIKKITGDENYILVGESYGGYLMRKLIKDEPEKIIGAMFVCPVIIPEYKNRDVPERKIIYNEIFDKNITESHVYQEFFNMAVFSNMDILKEYKENIYGGIKSADEEYLKIYQKHGYAYLENVDEIKESFNKPVLFVMGKQDHVAGYADAYKIIGNYPRASICILDEAGHNLQIEKIKILKVLTEDLLDRIKRNMQKCTHTA